MKRVTRRALVKQVIRLSDPDADDHPNLGRYDVSLRHVHGSDSNWWVSLDTTEDLLHALELDKPQGFTRLCARVGGRCVGTLTVIPDATTSGLGSKEISRASSSRATLPTPVKTETPLAVPAKAKSPTSTENGDTKIPIHSQVKTESSALSGNTPSVFDDEEEDEQLEAGMDASLFGSVLGTGASDHRATDLSHRTTRRRVQPTRGHESDESRDVLASDDDEEELRALDVRARRDTRHEVDRGNTSSPELVHD
jgi:hypothetical protein